MTKFKGEVCDFALNYLKEHSGYRWSDVLDYICEKMDLDTEFEDIIQDCCKRMNKPLEEVCYEATTNTKVFDNGLTHFSAFANLIGIELKNRFLKQLEKEL